MIESVALFCIFIVLLLLWKTRRPPNYPPGPTPLPLFGNIFQMPKGKHLWQAVEQFSKQYGPIIGLTIAGQHLVLVTGVDTVLAAMRKEEFNSRPDTFSVKDRSMGKALGIFFSSGEQWMSTRKFVVKHIRAYGRTEKENVIADEISRLMETIKEGNMEGTGIFGLSAVNVILTVLANRRIDFSDERSRNFHKNITLIFRQGNPSGMDVVDFFPPLRFFNARYKSSHNLVLEVQGYLREIVQEHREVLDPNNPLDLIDNYLVEMEHGQEKNNPLFSEDDLIMVGFDLFSAGSESTSNTIEFLLMYMLLHPEIQAKMQEELDQVLGRSRKPVLDDTAQMHYTMAVLNEVQRINTIAPTNVAHTCTRDTTFGGYFIPKGTTVSMDLWALGHDPKYWKNPDDFVPERFLNADGKYTKSSFFYNFGIGSRACVGEMFARNTIFLFTTTFFERFSISLPPGEPKPCTMALPGFTTAPRPFKIHVKSRY